jgi:hypothetical protein
VTQLDLFLVETVVVVAWCGRSAWTISRIVEVMIDAASWGVISLGSGDGNNRDTTGEFGDRCGNNNENQFVWAIKIMKTVSVFQVFS